MTKKFHRIYDFNSSILNRDKHMSFEACFYTRADKSIGLEGRVLNSNNIEILRSGDFRDFIDLSAGDPYERWMPESKLSAIINELSNKESIENELDFGSPLCELGFTISGPIAYRNTMGVKITMNGPFTVLNEQPWEESGWIGVGLLVDRKELLAFFENLLADYKNLSISLQNMGA